MKPVIEFLPLHSENHLLSLFYVYEVGKADSTSVTALFPLSDGRIFLLFCMISSFSEYRTTFPAGFPIFWEIQRRAPSLRKANHPRRRHSQRRKAECSGGSADLFCHSGKVCVAAAKRKSE